VSRRKPGALRLAFTGGTAAANRTDRKNAKSPSPPFALNNAFRWITSLPRSISMPPPHRDIITISISSARPRTCAAPGAMALDAERDYKSAVNLRETAECPLFMPPPVPSPRLCPGHPLYVSTARPARITHYQAARAKLALLAELSSACH